MAEQKKPAAPAAKDVKKDESKPEAAPKKGFPIKTIMVLVAAMIIEAIAIVGAIHFSAGPAKVKADSAAEDMAAQAEMPVEIQVLADKFQNTRTGRTYIYDTDIYIIVRKKDQDRVEEGLKRMSAAVSTEISTIFRRAEPAHLLEPTLATLTRQVQAVLDSKLGKDAEAKSFIQQVLIKKCTQFRVDM